VADENDDYCGCCGALCVGAWCEPCKPHIKRDAEKPWLATYYAQHGKDCPNYIKALAASYTDDAP
jgi:hypothetical protein